MVSVSTFLWFDSAAGEAAEFYTSIVPNSRILNSQVYPEGSPAAGEVLTVTFELDGQKFQALNAGPRFSFTEAVSIFVEVDTQREVDQLWAAITGDGGEEGQCGWAKDRWGVSWQIVPKALGETIGGADAAGAQRAMQAMLQMRKLDIDALRSAYAGE